jgi:hypothetical protein
VRIATRSVQTVLPSPIDEPGAVFMTADASCVFLGGRDASGEGRIVVYRQEGSGFSAVASGTLPGRDVVGIAYATAARRLYVLDHAHREIVWAPYRAGSALPTTWTTLVASSTEPLLAAIDFHELRLAADGAEPRISVVDYRLLPGDLLDVTHLASGSVKLEQHLGPALRAGRIDALALRAGDTSVPVKGPPRTHVEVLRMDGEPPEQVVGSATTDASGDAVVTTSALVPGAIYGARSSSWPDPSAPFLAAHTIEGVNDVLTAGHAIAPQLAHGNACFRGNPLFVFALEVVHEGGTAKPAGVVAYPVRLVLGTPGDEIADLGGGRRALIGTVSLAEQVEVGTGSSRYGDARVASPSVAIPIAIPDDPALVGGVVLCQWYVVLGPTDIRVSQITGWVVRDGRWIPPHARELFTPPSDAHAPRVAARAAQETSDPEGSEAKSARIRAWRRTIENSRPFSWNEVKSGLGR